jgi:hypothetical protein
MTACPVNKKTFGLVFKDEKKVGLGTITIDQKMDKLYVDKS